MVPFVCECGNEIRLPKAIVESACAACAERLHCDTSQVGPAVTCRCGKVVGPVGAMRKSVAIMLNTRP
jgi:hypothetical protein